MKLDRHLNLVVPVQTETGTVYVHSTPIRREVFEAHFEVIARTYAAMYTGNLTAFAAPRVAHLLLRKTAQAMGAWEPVRDEAGKVTVAGVGDSLIPEIRRLTNVLMPTAQGWQTVPFDDVRANRLLDDDDLAEVENVVIFFILASAMQRRKDLPGILGVVSSLWDAQTTSSNCTEFASSLPTSTAAATTGAKAPPLSIPR